MNPEKIGHYKDRDMDLFLLERNSISDPLVVNDVASAEVIRGAFQAPERFIDEYVNDGISE